MNKYLLNKSEDISYIWCTVVLLAQQVSRIQFTVTVYYTDNNKRVESPTALNWNSSSAEAVFGLKIL